MKYEERVAAYATSRVLANVAAANGAIRGHPDEAGIGRSLGTNAEGIRSLIACFVGRDRWETRALWRDTTLRLLTEALAAYRERHGLAAAADIDPGRPLRSELPPPRARKPPKPPAPPDTSEYGLAKQEYLVVLARLKAAKKRRDAAGGGA